MIDLLKKLFDTNELNQSSQPSQQSIHTAAAALLIETARADFDADKREQALISSLLQKVLGLDAATVTELIEATESEVHQATSLYEFTRVINDKYAEKDKQQLIEAMWKVAYADGNLDKYEEHLIRQVAELIYVSHQVFIQTKLRVAEQAKQ